MNDVELAIRMTADASDAATAMDSVGDAATRMASDVDSATAKTDAATSRLDSAADSADHMASSSSQAAGGLGDLGGALALMPGPLGAMGAGMEAAAPAIMGVTGASDLMSLAMNSNVVQTTRAKAAAIAHRTVMIAQRAATLAAAGAQRVLNLAMRANPVGLLITAVTIAIGLVVLLYKRSETFRRIVQAVFAAAKTYVSTYIAILTSVVGFFRDKLPAAALWLRDRVRDVFDAIGDKIATVREVVARAGDAIRDKLGAAFDWVLDKIQPLIDKVQGLVDAVQSIDLPDLPGFRTAATTTTAAGASNTVEIHLPLFSRLDTSSIAALIAALDAWYASMGLKVQLVPR